MSARQPRARGCRRLAAASTVLLCVAVLAGCGSSKPAYCSDAANLKTSVQQLGSISSPAQLKTALQGIDKNATALAKSAAGSFPTETSAVKSSLSKLESSVNQLVSGQTSALKQIPAEASALANAVTGFSNSAKSKCG